MFIRGEKSIESEGHKTPKMTVQLIRLSMLVTEAAHQTSESGIPSTTRHLVGVLGIVVLTALCQLVVQHPPRGRGAVLACHCMDRYLDPHG